jgi:2-octaprenyl-6-methoxyphenol hydroxylase
MNAPYRYRAVVVGGGLSGLAAATAVGRAGIETLHVAPKAPPDRRTSALMQPSVDFLQSAGLLAAPEAIGHPLRRIRIIDATSRLIRAPETLFDSAEAGLTAFGWNFPNEALLATFESALAAYPNVSRRQSVLDSLDRLQDHWRLTLADGQVVEADLLVGADGKRSLVREAAGFGARENGFAEAALVADLELDRPLEDTSVEFHYERGPFTLVPAGGRRANLVWIDDRKTLEAARAQSAADLSATLAAKAMHLFGTPAPVSPTFVFLLSSLTVATAGQSGAVLVGEAAHAFPPIGAQGLNLGLRDVAGLAASLAATDTSAPDWAERVSRDYARRRAGDLARTGGMVDALFRSLLADFLPAQLLRAGGLWALKSLPPLRRKAFSLGMGA